MRSDTYTNKKRNNERDRMRGRTGFGARIKNLFQQKFTVMFIPHSEKKVFNFQVSMVLLVFVSLIVAIVVGIFFYQTTVYSGNEQILAEQQQDLMLSQANLDTVLDEVSELFKVYEIFESAMSGTLNALDLAGVDNGVITGSGDLNSVSGRQEVGSGEAREIYDLQNLRNSLSSAVQPLEDIRNVLQAHKQLLTDLPTLWPVSGGRSVVTMEFGPNMHPINGTWYLHKGIDISGPLGLPILASANGRVLEAEEDTVHGYGNYVLIEHKYGFKTRYSHMDTILVSPGDTVSQGDRVGTLGNTGLSTGSHLDFQIMLGTEVLDPASFLKIRNTFTRWTGNR